MPATFRNVNTSRMSPWTMLERVMTPRAPITARASNMMKTNLSAMLPPLAPVELFMSVCLIGHQSILGEVEVTLVVGGQLVHARHHEGRARADLLAEAAEDAAGEVDVEDVDTLVVALLRGLDGDAVRGADGLAQPTPAAVKSAGFRIGEQGVHAPEPGLRDDLLLGILHRYLVLEEVTPGDGHPLEDLEEGGLLDDALQT